MSRLVVLTTSWPRFTGDTAGAFVFQWAKSLSLLGHSILVLCPVASGYPAQEVVGSIEVIRVSYPLSGSLFYHSGAPENLSASWRPWVEIPFFLGAMTREIIKYARGADLIVGHWILPMGLLAATLGNALGVPSAGIAHSGDVHLLSKALGLPALQYFFRRTRIACVAPHQKKILEKICTPEVIPMGVEEELFEAPTRRQEARAKLQLTNFTVLFLGRLVPIKNIGGLVRAAANLDITLCIAGDGPEKVSLETLCQEQKVRAIFLGQVSGEERLDAFAAADAFVLPSLILANGRSEGLPVSLLEAAAARLPCITSTSGGANSFFTKDEVLSFEAGDEAALRVQLMRLEKDASLRERLAQRAQDKVQELRWASIAARYATFLGLENCSQ
jgi:glycosyltransferase involved in cell wall biosynthesis